MAESVHVAAHGFRPAPILGVKNESALRLDRTALVNRHIGRVTGIDIELAEQVMKAKPRYLLSKAETKGAIFVMYAQGDHALLEARISYARHGEKKLAAEKGGLHHIPMAREVRNSALYRSARGW